MSEPDVLRLDAYRERRGLRLRLGASLNQADPGRAELFEHLVRLASLLGTDRAAVVWIDEYGQGLVHPFVVLDLLSDRPRRSFPPDLLRKAWEAGLPGLFASHGSGASRVDGSGWAVAVALGSDGTRSWFLASDAVSVGTVLSPEVRRRLLFLAGQCAALVLHRDMDPTPLAETDPSTPAPHFAGWPILQDIIGREEDEDESRRIAIRFVVARLPRLLVDDDLAIPRERLREQAHRAREEVDKDSVELDAGAEADLWYEVLDAFQVGDLERLGRALLSLGRAVEARSHLNGAQELYRMAYEIFSAVADVAAAVDAARANARVLDGLTQTGEAVRWGAIAREVEEAAGLDTRGPGGGF